METQSKTSIGRFGNYVRRAREKINIGWTDLMILSYLYDHGAPTPEQVLEKAKSAIHPTNGNHKGEQLELANLPRRMENYIKNPPGILIYVPRTLVNDDDLVGKVNELAGRMQVLEKENLYLKQQNEDLRVKLMRLIFMEQ